MLGEGVDAAPGGNNDRVEEFLRATSPFDPELTNEHENGQENAIGDEGTAHDEVRQTLADMFPLAEAQGGDAAKNQLNPDNDWEGFAGNAMCDADVRADATLETLFEVKSEVDAKDELGKHVEVDPVAEMGVDVVREELATAVHMAQGVTEQGQEGGQDLCRDVPSAFYYLSGAKQLSVPDLVSCLILLLLLRCLRWRQRFVKDSIAQGIL